MIFYAFKIILIKPKINLKKLRRCINIPPLPSKFGTKFFVKFKCSIPQSYANCFKCRLNYRLRVWCHKKWIKRVQKEYHNLSTKERTNILAVQLLTENRCCTPGYDIHAFFCYCFGLGYNIATSTGHVGPRTSDILVERQIRNHFTTTLFYHRN